MVYMIREAQSSYTVVAKTHAGMTGKNNEDRFGVSAFRMDENSDAKALLAVLCDGIGGHKAGEIAAELAVNTISEIVARSNGDSPLAALEQGIHLANQAIFEEAQKDNGKRGMGSTCACAFLIDNQLYTAAVGDSRIYLMRGDRIRQISIDHTWIQEALDAGIITAEQAVNHPNRHVIRRYLGGPQPPQVDFRLRLNKGENDDKAQRNQGLALQAGDRLLLCSDGLTDLVSDAEILAALDGGDFDAAVQSLVDLANQRGGHDNTTIIFLEIPENVVKKSAPKKRSWLPYGCVSLAIILGVIAAAVLGYFWWKGWPWELGDKTPTPPVQATLNPIITSAPQDTATIKPTWTAEPTPIYTNTPETTITLTPEPTVVFKETSAAYPEPKIDSTEDTYP